MWYTPARLDHILLPFVLDRKVYIYQRNKDFIRKIKGIRVHPNILLSMFYMYSILDRIDILEAVNKSFRNINALKKL